METIAFLNQKGGVAKTTTAIQTAARIYQKGHTVLSVDLDSQCNFSLVCGVNPSDDDITLYDAFSKRASAKDAISHAQIGFDVLPGGAGMALADMDFSEDGSEYMLKNVLDSLAADYEYCIIDCSPHLGILAVNAIAAADTLIIPVNADLFSVQALSKTYDFIYDASLEYNQDMKLGGILITRYSPRQSSCKTAAEQIQAIAEDIDVKLYKTRIRESAVMRNATSYGMDIFSFDKRSGIASDYDDFINELLESEEK